MKEGREIRFIDLFSGIGGFRYGLEKANREVRDGLQNLEARGGSPDASIGMRNWGVQSENTPCGSGIGLERAGQISEHTELRIRDTEGQPEQHSKGGGSGEGSSSNSFRCVWSCDNNKYANQVYTKHFGEANHHPGDIRGVDPREIPDFDLLCAGFPCQSFSVAGPRTGFQDTRGTLFFEISRIAEAKRPQMLLLENVKGLLSNDRGQTFQTILQELGRIGYWAEWQILNSKHHGVPQNRERVFIIGHLRGTGGREIFPIGETDEVAEEDGKGRPPVQAEVSTAIDGSYYKGVDRHGQRTVVLDTFNRGSKEEEAYALKTNPSPTSSAIVALRQVGTLGKDDQASRVYSTDGLSPTIPTPGGGHHMPKIVTPVLTPDRAEKRQHGRRFKEPGDPSFTLTGQDIHGVAISFTNPHDSEEERGINLSDTSRAVKPPYGNQQPLTIDTDKYRIRRLTPVECERLQGFPDGWTEFGYVKDAVLDYEPVYGWKEKYDEETDEWEEYWTIIGKNPIDPITNTVRISDTQRYRALGNAVTTNVIAFLGRKILEAEK